MGRLIAWVVAVLLWANPFLVMGQHDSLRRNQPDTVHNHSGTTLHEVVVSGTMRPMSRAESPVPVEVYHTSFLRQQPAPSIFESLGLINGVRPAISCNVCNTGGIHINGLDGPYTLVMIDGMPVVSGLATVYGLHGIPQSLIERIEVVKGPASALYGSEAVAGLINIITKSPDKAPAFSLETFSSDWKDLNIDLGVRWKAGKKIRGLLGINHFHYQDPKDRNGDGFTDISLQKRLSVFNSWKMQRKYDRDFTWAARYVYEDRWGGEMNWDKRFRGGDSIYGESIFTNRWEMMANYQLPVDEKIYLQASLNRHDQNSVYGQTVYIARQWIGFAQLSWHKNIGKHQGLLGLGYRYTWYDDNTPATSAMQQNQWLNMPAITALPGLFVQDDIRISKQHRLLLGLRLDRHPLHGAVSSVRANYKWTSPHEKTVLRIGAGNGFRVANVFTEDHAALTGARTLQFEETLKPERSWNVQANLQQKLNLGNDHALMLEAGLFYTYFNNRILPDYLTDPNKIIYRNIRQAAVSRGASLNITATGIRRLSLNAGITLLDVSVSKNGNRERVPLTEQYSATWMMSYHLHRLNLHIDYNGNLTGPMILPLLGPLDDRPGRSPAWSNQSIQLRYGFGKGFECFGGIKNLLNSLPPANSIARAHDPFDKLVQFDGNGQVVATPENPRALTFDPTYAYAPNQGIRGFIGLRYTKK